jgi:tetratricopeptide (TPR) repeat protein
MEKKTLTPAKTIAKGKKLFSQKKYASAMEQFLSAAQWYEQEKDALMVAEMHNNLSVCHLMMGDATKALQEAKDTDRIFSQGGDTKRQAMALGNQAAAQEALKHPGEALELYRKSEILLKQIGERELRSIVLKHISALQIKTGDKYQALASMDAALNESPKPSPKEKVLKHMLDKIFTPSKHR